MLALPELTAAALTFAALRTGLVAAGLAHKLPTEVLALLWFAREWQSASAGERNDCGREKARPGLQPRFTLVCTPGPI